MFCASLSTSVVAGLPLVVLILIGRHPQQKPPGNFGVKKSLLFIGPVKHKVHWPNSEVAGRERENTWAWGSPLFGVEVLGLGFCGLTFYW